MSVWLLFLSLIFLVAAVVSFAIFAVKKILKKPTCCGKIVPWTAGASLGAFVLMFLLDDISSGMILIAFFSFVVSLISLLLGIVAAILKKRKAKFFIICFVAFTVTAAGIILSTVSWNNKIADPVNYEISIKTEFDFPVTDGDEPIEVTTSKGFDGSAVRSKYRFIYDACDYRLLLDNSHATAEQCLEAIEKNSALKSEYKNYFKDFVKRIAEKYPEANLSVLYKNLLTLKVIELDRKDYLLKSLSVDSLGCYHNAENTIYIPKGTKYIEGEFGFQVLLHEFCHASRISWWDTADGVQNRITEKSQPDTILLCEALNSAFSCSLLNYYEWDIAYQVPSNYLRIMLECMDNYELTDYMNHSEAYFLSKLDAFTGHTNYAEVIWKLISVQRSDWESDLTDIPAERYYPIYDYLCKMYYGKYITPDMNDAERKKVADDLVHKAFFDAPEGYKTDEQYFYDYLKNQTDF